MTERSKRNVKLPKHLEDAGYIDPSLGETKFVYRHLRKDELTGSLAQETVYVLWPDDGIWYQAQVKKFKAADQTATLYYTRTDELENDVDLKELMEARQIAKRERRPKSYELGDDEVLCTKENQDGEEDEAYGLVGDEEEEEEPQDDDDEEEEEPQDEDDEDYHVGEGEADVDEDGPLSGSKRKASRIEVDDVRAQGQVLLNSILGASGPSPPKRHASKPKPLPRKLDEETRAKLREALTTRLAKAVQEAEERGEDVAPYDQARKLRLVSDIETALFEVVGKTVDKGYKDKARSVLFNLNDSSNPDLRRGVLTGSISAVRLVRMTPEEMAPRRLQEERRKLEEKSLKMRVLPGGTEYINYVTRREELVQRDAGRVKTPPLRGASPEEGARPRGATPPAILPGPAAPPVPGPLIKTPSTGGGEAPAAAYAVDWAAIRAQAATAAEEAKAAGQLEGFDDDLMASDLLVDDPAQNEAPVAPPPEEASPRPSSPPPPVVLVPSPLADVEGLELWQHAGLPRGGLEGPGSLHPNSVVWPAGTLSVPGSGQYSVQARFLCGGGDLTAMFASVSKVEVEGRVGEDKLERFLHDLRNSRSRSVTLAVVTTTSSDTQTDSESESFMQVISGYASRMRAGVAHVNSGLEMYFVAPAGLGQRLLRTAHDSALASGAPLALRQLLPSSLDDNHMLLAVVHSKTWKPVAAPAAPPVAANADEYDPVQAPLASLSSVDALVKTASTTEPAASVPFQLPDAAALSALLSSLPPTAPAQGMPEPQVMQPAPAGDLALAFDPNALNDLAATLLGPAANPAPLQPPPPRPMFRDPRAGPTVPLDMPPELVMELQRLRGGPAMMPQQQAPVFGGDGGRRRKWDVVG